MAYNLIIYHSIRIYLIDLLIFFSYFFINSSICYLDVIIFVQYLPVIAVCNLAYAYIKRQLFQAYGYGHIFLFIGMYCKSIVFSIICNSYCRVAINHCFKQGWHSVLLFHLFKRFITNLVVSVCTFFAVIVNYIHTCLIYIHRPLKCIRDTHTVILRVFQICIIYPLIILGVSITCAQHVLYICYGFFLIICGQLWKYWYKCLQLCIWYKFLPHLIVYFVPVHNCLSIRIHWIESLFIILCYLRVHFCLYITSFCFQCPAIHRIYILNGSYINQSCQFFNCSAESFQVHIFVPKPCCI